MPSIASSALAAGGRRRGWQLLVHLPAPASHPATAQDSPNTDGYRRHRHRRTALAGNPAAPPDTAPHPGLCRPAGDSTSPTERRGEERGSRLPREFSADRVYRGRPWKEPQGCVVPTGPAQSAQACDGDTAMGTQHERGPESSGTAGTEEPGVLKPITEVLTTKQTRICFLSFFHFPVTLSL